MESIFNNAIAWIDASKYVLLFFGCIFEGPVVMLTGGFLFSLGQLDFIPMYTALVLGDFTADIGWYAVGRFGTRRIITNYGHYIGVTPEVLNKVEHKFKHYHEKILIISKLTMGLGFAFVVLIVAGIVKVPFKNYVILNLLGGFVWTAFLIIIGFFFGNIYSMIAGPLRFVFATGILVLFIIALRQASRYLKNKGI